MARSRDAVQFARATAKLEPIGIPGRSKAAFGGVTRIYVLHVRIPRPGRYPGSSPKPDGVKTQALGVIDLAARGKAKFEGSVSAAELAALIRSRLL